MAAQQSPAITAFKEHERSQPTMWVARRSPGSFSYMEVTYKCGCIVRANEVDHACSKHGEGIKRIVRTTEYL